MEPALVAGLPVIPLAARFAVAELVSAVLAVVVGARFTPSLTEARGRAEAEDLSDVADSGRVGTVGGDLAPAAALDTAAEEDVGFVGAREALRVGAGGPLVVDCLAGGGILVRLETGAALDDFLIVEVAVVGLVAVADDEAVALDVAAGAVFAEPAPNVPELRTCVIKASKIKHTLC